MSPMRKPSNLQFVDSVVSASSGLEKLASTSDGTACLDARIKVITPIIGGGSEAGTSSTIDPIRAASIRGALRFWWRATVDCHGISAAGLCEEERALFGGTGSGDLGVPSRVKVSVKIENPGQFGPAGKHPDRRGKDGKPRPPSALAHFNCGPAYALWTLQQPDSVRNQSQYLGRACPTKSVRTGVSFSLCVTFPAEHESEIVTALRAWIAFGGYGARTRRGLGSLELLEDLRLSGGASVNTRTFPRCWTLNEIRTDLGGALGTIGGPGLQHRWPHLKGAYVFVGSPCDSARDAWENAIQALADIRQGEGTGRKKRDPVPDSKPGRSYWPEPDLLRTIRSTFGRVDWGTHAPRTPLNRNFLRADFGLPIQFKFQKGNPAARNDPEADSTLSYAPTDRLASPLIVKALPVNVDGRIQYAPMAVLLNVVRANALAGDVCLTFKNGSVYHPSAAELKPAATPFSLGSMPVPKNADAFDIFFSNFTHLNHGFEVTI